MTSRRKKQHVLFVCSQNRLRSPTAEQVFAPFPGITVASAGVADDAEVRLSPELLAWALYDVANSAWMTTILLIFPLYFVNVAASGMRAWPTTRSCSTRNRRASA